MKIICIGGGPAGIYLAIAMKRLNPDHQIIVMERNKPNDTFGWGVVFSDQTMDNLKSCDPISADIMTGELIHWDHIDVCIHGHTERSGGHGFIGIGRRRMLEILYQRANELGVELQFESEVDYKNLPQQFPEADLIVASDGLNSKIRNSDLNWFKCEIDQRPNKFVWLGTHQRFDEAFAFIFEKTKHGWIWAHAYQFDQQTSTFIVECSAETYEQWGFEQMTHAQSAETCRKIFESYLGGHQLMSNAAHIRGSAWINFPKVLCRNWIKDNLVLIGDAAHTAHFSIGSGTKLGFEDAISLAKHLHSEQDLKLALQQYQDERELEALKLQSAARNSMNWFEEIERYLNFDIKQFSYTLLTRSQRVSHENLRLRDPSWLKTVEEQFAKKSGLKNRPVPPMFTPFELRKLKLCNRIVVSPMSMYSAKDGMPDDWHFAHYAALAKGGAGLIFTEMTDISEDARITPGCAGIWTQAQQSAWKRIVDFVHQHSQAKCCLQLGHAGPKGSTRVMWEGMDLPLKQGNWPIYSPSAIAYSGDTQTPKAMNRQQMKQVLDDYVSAAERAQIAGFDMLEMHFAHGYLISAFLTPILNRREDEYGGSLQNRLRYPLEVFAAVRAQWPQDKPMSVRISANDWLGDEGITPADAVHIATAFKAAGADIIDVSAGQTSLKAKPVYGRMFQTPFSDRIRNEAKIATMAVGNIYEIDHVNSILAAGRADLCCLGRAHLLDPNWTLRAAAEQHYTGPAVQCPIQYQSGFEQMERNLQRAKEMALQS